MPPRGCRLRFAVLDQYDGTSWHASDAAHLIAENSEDRYLRVSEDITSTAVGEPLAITVRVLDEWDLPWVPTAGNLTSFEFSFADEQRFEQLRYNPALDAAVMTDRLTPSDDYAFTAVLADDSLDRSMEPGPDLDPDTASWAGFLEEPLAAWAGNPRRPVPALLRFGERLREDGRYTDGADAGEARYRAATASIGSARGSCSRPTAGNDEQYAATMALAASELGIPARVVVGATVPRGSVVRGRDVSAWVEVQVADGSWRTLPTEQFMSTRAVEQLDPAVVPVGGGQRAFPDLEELPPPPEEQESPARSARDVLTDRDSWRWAVVLLALVGVVPGVKLVRRRQRLGAARATARYAGAWRELVDHARDLGHAVPVGLTRPAEARLLAEVVPDAARLADEADRVVFGLDEPTEADAAAYWRRVRRERRHLGGARRPWRRVWAPFSLGSIRVAATQGP